MPRLKVLLGAMLLTATMVGAFAFASKDFHKPLDTVCFQFNQAAPNSTNVLLSDSYTEASSNCPAVPQKWCAICFDTEEHPEYLNDDGDLDFTNGTLNSIVNSNWNVPGQDGVTISGITLHYRRIAP